MKRLTIGLALVVVLLLMLAAIAVAAPSGDFCVDHQDNPNCTEPTPTTTTTAPPAQQPCPTGEITITANGYVEYECDWTPIYPGESAPYEGTVRLTSDRPVSKVVIAVLDSVPGDICTLVQGWEEKTGQVFQASFALSYSALPDGFDPDYAAWENQTYWGWNDAHWCYPQDLMPGMRDDLNGEPLDLHVGFVAKKGTTATITLTPEQGQ
jgi:hypothetical protein